MSNAWGFFGAGMVMEWLHGLPSVTGVREAWLVVMGAVMMGVGATWLAQAGWRWIKPRLVTPMLWWLPAPATVREREAPEGRGVRSQTIRPI